MRVPSVLLSLFVLAITASGCRCRRDRDVVRPEDDAVAIVHDAATPPTPSTEPRFVLVRGDLVDLEARTDALWFTTPPRAWISDAQRLFVIDDDGVRGYEPPTTGWKWRTPASSSVGFAKAIVAWDPWLVGVWEHNVARFDRSTGARTLLLPGAGAAFEDAVILGDAAFVLDASGTVTVVELSTATVRATLPPPGSPPWSGDLVPFDVVGTVCRVTRGPDVQVDCIDPSGVVRWAKSYVLPPGASPGCMMARGRSEHHLLLTGRWSGTCGTFVVRAQDGGMALAWIGNGSAIVEDAAGGVDGIVAVPFGGSTTGDVLFTDPRGATRWTTKMGGYGEDFAAVRRGATLILARWDLIATGSELSAFDAKSGALVWNADVEQLSIPHSKYHNDVELRARGDDLVLIGRESGGAYVQIFDASTGARRYAHLLK